MYKIIDKGYNEFILEIRDNKYRFKMKITNDTHHITRDLVDKVKEIAYENDMNRFFRKELNKVIISYLYNTLKEEKYFEEYRGQYIDFHMFIDGERYRLNGCPNAYGLISDCSLSCCECKFKSFRIMYTSEVIKSDFDKIKGDKEIKIIEDLIDGDEKKEIFKDFKNGENLKNKRCSFISEDYIKILCPRYIYLEDKGCPTVCNDENKCRSCWINAKKCFDEGEE